MHSPVTRVSCLPHFSGHGQSFPEDVRRKTKSHWALAQLPAGSPVAEFYVALLRDAEGDIRRKKKEDDALTALARGKVETAAHALRYHLVFVARLLAEQLGATPTFRADGNYELGELLPPVLARIRSLYGKAADSAHSSGKADQQALVASRKAALSNSNAAVSVDQCAVNKGVHFNEWANFGRKDFEPVVAAYKELVVHFRCTGCAGFLYVAPARGLRRLSVAPAWASISTW